MHATSTPMTGTPVRSAIAAITPATGSSGAAAASARVRSAVVTEPHACASRYVPSPARKREGPIHASSACHTAPPFL